jgi:hypothetical protein
MLTAEETELLMIERSESKLLGSLGLTGIAFRIEVNGSKAKMFDLALELIID